MATETLIDNNPQLFTTDNLKEIKIKASKRAVFSSFKNITSYLNNCHSHEAFCEGINNILDAYKINKNYNKGESNIVNDLIDTTKNVQKTSNIY